MKKCSFVALCVAAAVHVSAQQRAPHNESIRQEDLRADLFFLAGDSMRGRLTDTEENRAAADYLRSRFERIPPGVLNKDAFAEYLRAFQLPGSIHASCEDYRAGATIDLDHDAADLDHKISCPVLILWGERGAWPKLYNVLDVWRERGSNVSGRELPTGHFIAEEKPEMLLEELNKFLS